MLFLDADGATDIRDMSRLEKAIDELTTDYKVPAVAVGSRAHLQDEAVAKVRLPPHLLWCSQVLLITFPAFLVS